MLLEKAKFVNVCQHRDVEVEFGPGITAISGPNGSGKSNMMGLVRACVTNDYTALRGTKDMNIRRGKRADEPSYTETTWSTPAGQLVVRRALYGVDSAVYLNDKVIVQGKEKDVTDKALAYLGTTSSILDDFSLITYAQLREIVDGSKAARTRLFTSLCGIEQVEKLDRYMRESHNNAKAVVEEMDMAGLDVAREIWHDKKRDVRELAKQLSGLDDLRVDPKDLEKKRNRLGDMVRAIEGFSEATERRNKAKESLRKAEASLREAKATSARCERYLARCETLVDRLVTLLPEIKSRIENRQQNWKAYQAVREAKDAVKSPEPEKPGCRIKTSREDAERAALQADEDFKRMSRQLQMAIDGEATDCPTCGQPVDASEERLEQLREGMDTAKQSKSAAAAVLKGYREYDEKLGHYRREHDKWSRERDIALRVLDTMTQAADRYEADASSKGDREYADAKSAQLSRVRQRRGEVQDRLSAARKTIANAKASVGTHRATIKEAEDVRNNFDKQSKSKVQALRDEVASDEKINEQFGLVRSQLHVAREQARSAQSRLREKLAHRRRCDSLKRWMSVCERTRDVCKRDRLPLRIVRSTVERTTAGVNAYLGQFNLPFVVAVDVEEFAFNAIHADRTVEPAFRLSTGQSLCLAIAFWLSRAMIFHGHFPLFCLDEPTANLDSERVLNVADVIGILSNKLVNEGRQGIVITHSTALAANATRQFHLG